MHKVLETTMLKVKTHYRGAKIVVSLYYFPKVSCLNFNHVIIMKKNCNIFAYYGRSKPKEIKCQINYIFLEYEVMLKYISAQKKCHKVPKKCKYIHEMIEMIFNVYEICNIY